MVLATYKIIGIKFLGSTYERFYKHVTFYPKSKNYALYV